jgi:hypothetical protein
MRLFASNHLKRVVFCGKINTSSMSRSLKTGLIIFSTLLLLGVFILALVPTPTEKSTPTATINSTSTANPSGDTSTPGSALGNLANNIPEFTAVPSDTTGVIEGSFTYRNENELPSGMKVCAVNQQTFKEFCTSEFMDSTYYLYGVGYRLELDPGQYTVYSQLRGEDYRAYYTPYVVCGHREGCQSHTPTRVTVTATEVTDGIDPQDWSEAP